jgi:hypothetical protein
MTRSNVYQKIKFRRKNRKIFVLEVLSGNIHSVCDVQRVFLYLGTLARIYVDVERIFRTFQISAVSVDRPVARFHVPNRLTAEK